MAKTDGGKGPRIPGANTPASLSAYEHGYAGIKWGDGTDEQPIDLRADHLARVSKLGAERMDEEMMNLAGVSSGTPE